MEKTSVFFGYNDFSDCIHGIDDDELFNRALNLLSHGRYSLYQPQKMGTTQRIYSQKYLMGFWIVTSSTCLNYSIIETMSNLILYITEDGKDRIQLRAKGATVWLTQREMSELFAVSQDNIGLHLKNIYADQELERRATTEDSSVVQTEGGREVRRNVTLYNLDAILAVGYRVRSPRGVQFRRWASTVLKEYLLKGFAMDDERLKNPDGRPDFFDEMLARIRDIRASEKRFYQKVRDLFALSVDYDKSDQATQQFSPASRTSCSSQSPEKPLLNSSRNEPTPAIRISAFLPGKATRYASRIF